MVSTRRTAQKEPQAELHGDATLKKKPVRKAPAKQAEPEMKPKTVRGGKAVPAPTTAQKDVEEPVAKKPTARSKPIASKATEKPGKDTAAKTTKPTPNPTRATRTTKKVDIPSEDAPKLSAPPEKPPVRRTRAAATKAQPLSPKKITQVTRPASRVIKATSVSKTTGKPAPAKQAPRKTRATRRRAPSDENAGIQQPQVEVEGDFHESDEQDSIVVEQLQRPNSELSMSSRPTTPSEAGVPDSENEEGEYVDEGEDDRGIDSAADHTGETNASGSEDELCGPKTPMKRSSPGSQTRYLTSVQRTIKKYDSEIPDRTPVRRNAHTGKTPLTQKQASQITLPASDRRPLTVARGADRAFVFRDLAPIPIAEEPADTGSVSDQEDFTLFEGVDKSRTPAMEYAHTPSYDSADDGETSSVEDSILGSTASAEAEMEDRVPVQPVQDMDFDETEVASGEENDPTDDTVVVREIEQESESVESDESYDEQGTEEDVAVQTMVWENIRQDVTLQIDFDSHFADANMLPQPEPTERLDIASEGLSYESIVEDASEECEQPALNISNENVNNGEINLEALSTSRRATLNLAEFLEPIALASPVKAIPESVIASDQSQVEGDIVMEDVEDASVVSAVTSDHEEVLDKTTHMGNLDLPSPSAPSRPSEQKVDQSLEVDLSATPKTPHYALPTFAFDARRKSVPAITSQTPVRLSIRPNTSDGASMPRVLVPFNRTQFESVRPIAGTPVRPRTQHGSTPARAATPKAFGERYPRLNPEQTYEALAKTAMAPRRFQTPITTPMKRPATTQKMREDAPTPPRSSLRIRDAAMRGNSVENPTTPVMVVPNLIPVEPRQETPVATPRERFPRLPVRQDYEEHANTVAGPARHATPFRSPVKRPKTAQKAASLRMLALKANTPMKTPLKAPAVTPAQIPMTPHPAAPLRGVTAMVEVFTLEGASASANFVALLHRLGAKTVKTWSDRVTHVVFKDGSPSTLQRVRLHNKEVAESGQGVPVHCVNSRWVTDCDTEGQRVDEGRKDDDGYEVYGVDMSAVPKGSQRRRKSMEPGVFQNIDGNVIRDRTSSWGKNSLRRSLARVDSPSEHTPSSDSQATPKAQTVNSPEPQASPETPDWLHPERLVQQTLPLKRVRKLDLAAKENRRMTGVDGVLF